MGLDEIRSANRRAVESAIRGKRSGFFVMRNSERPLANFKTWEDAPRGSKVVVSLEFV